jgi:hypothetical protein
MAKASTGKEARFLAALLDGKSFSRKQARILFRLGNPSATAHRIQSSGVDIQRTYKTIKPRDAKYATRIVTYSLAK